jgi:malonyl-CoA O-methyltransferase
MSISRARLQQNFSRAAAEYDSRAHFQQTETRRVLDAALMLLPHSARLADIGCGTGYFAQMARAKRPDWKIFGIDIAAGMCRAAAAHCGVAQADALQLPLAAASVDAVVSSLCLQWVTDPAAALTEIARVLRPGGRAILTSLTTETLRELHAAAAQAQLPLGLLPMRDEAIYRAAIAASSLETSLFQRQSTVEYYADVAALLASMRAIGAGNNLAASGQAMTGAQRWKAMLRAYETQRTPHGIPATWDRLFLVLGKPA